LEDGGKTGKLTMAKIKTGWVLLGALCTMGKYRNHWAAR